MDHGDPVHSEARGQVLRGDSYFTFRPGIFARSYRLAVHHIPLKGRVMLRCYSQTSSVPVVKERPLFAGKHGEESIVRILRYGHPAKGDTSGCYFHQASKVR